MWRPSLWFHSCSNQICLKPIFQIFSEQYEQRCFQTVLVVFNFCCWTKKTIVFLFYFSFSCFGSWVDHLEVLNQILRWKNNNMGKKENVIFLGVYFLLLNKVLKSIWVDMWINCTCLLPPKMDLHSRMQWRLQRWEASPKVFIIHHAQDAEPAIWHQWDELTVWCVSFILCCHIIISPYYLIDISQKQICFFPMASLILT